MPRPKKRQPRTLKTREKARSEVLEAVASPEAAEGYGLDWDTCDPGQKQLRISTILNLIQLGAPRVSARSLMESAFGCSGVQSDNLYRDVLRKMRDDFTDDLPFAKAAATLRLKRDLATMRGASKPKWSQILGHEKQLARIEGTEAPIKIAMLDVDEKMRENLATVLTTSTPARLRLLIARGREAAPHEGGV